MPLAATFLFDGGRQDHEVNAEIPPAMRRRFVEAQREVGWMLRLEVFDEQKPNGSVIAVAEIDVDDLARRPVRNCFSSTLVGAMRSMGRTTARRRCGGLPRMRHRRAHRG